MKKGGWLSPKSRSDWKALESLRKDIDSFRDIRNCAFHFGDFREKPATLIAMYEEIRDLDIQKLNMMLKALTNIGSQLSSDAMSQIR